MCGLSSITSSDPKLTEISFDAFHEKAGRGPVSSSCFLLVTDCLPAEPNSVSAGTGDRTATIQSFQSIHHTGKIFDHGEITSGQLAQQTYPGFAVVDGLEIMEAQPLGKPDNQMA
jgi:hypothetical protein